MYLHIYAYILCVDLPLQSNIIYICILCSVEGEISHDTQLEQIDESFKEVSNASDGVVLCEGTGKSALVLFYCEFA